MVIWIWVVGARWTASLSPDSSNTQRRSSLQFADVPSSDTADANAPQPIGQFVAVGTSDGCVSVDCCCFHAPVFQQQCKT